jgi:tetratricopeptide (TPR) repeat protein
MVVALAFSPDGRQLASGSEDDSICLWRLNDGARLWRGKHTADISSLSFSEKGTYLLSTSFDSTAVVRATEGGRTITAVQHQGTVRSGAFSPDERFFATAGEDRSVRLWGRDSGDLIAVLPHTCDVLRVIFAEDKASLITFGRRVPSASATAASRTASAGAMEVRRWSILGGTQSTRAFTQLGEFLGMREFGENQRLTLLNDPVKLDALWANYRKEAAPTGMDVGDFRLTEARQAEAFGDDESAAWHLRQPGPMRKDIDRLMDEARVFAAVGDWRRVIVATEQAKGATDSKDMQQDLLEMHAQAKLELGSASAENGELEAAKPELEHALDDYRKIAKLDPKGSLWRTQQAQALFLLSRHTEALAALDEAISIKPSPSHYRRKATIYLRLGDAKSYLATCHAALAQFPKGNERASAAWCCLLDVLPGSDASSPELDLAALLPIFEKNPGSYTQRNTLGALFYRLGGTVNTERSIEVLNESIQLFERSPARLNRDAYAVDSSLPGGRPVDWIFLAMAHFRYAADESAAISPTERERHDKLGVRYRSAVDQILRKNGPLSEFSAGPIAWNRLELEVLLAGCDRDYPRR